MNWPVDIPESFGYLAKQVCEVCDESSRQSYSAASGTDSDSSAVSATAGAAETDSVVENDTQTNIDTGVDTVTETETDANTSLPGTITSNRQCRTCPNGSDSISQNAQRRAPTLTFSSISMGGGHISGIRAADGAVACWGIIARYNWQ